MEIQFTSILQVVAFCMLGGLGWLARHMWMKYEDALVLAENSRRLATEAQIAEIKTIVAGLHSDIARISKEREAIHQFLTQWAENLVKTFSSQIGMDHDGIQALHDLKASILMLNEFFASAQNNEKSSVVKIGKDTFLVHRKDENKS